ncbi:hypothetical protein LFDSGCCC_CDS0034 [Phage C75C1]|nr:hypothetical protein LFDSGCCC_CDS0034 [Phage C75C1]
MTDEIKTDNVESEQKNTDNSLTPAEFMAQRVGSPKGESEVAEESKTEEEVVNKSATETEEEETEADVLSQLDIDDLSEDELKALSTKLNSRAVARYGELTKKRKAAEERMEQMERQLTELQNAKKEEVPVVKDNPLKDIVDPKELQEKAVNAQEVVDWAEDLLYEKGDYAPDDVIATVDGREVTKAEVRKTMRHSQNVLRKFVPAQMQEIQKKNAAIQARDAFAKKAEEELPWMKNKNSEAYKKYDAMINDRRLVDLQTINPEVAAQMPYLVAHAANSMYGRKVLPPTRTAPRAIKAAPPKSATTAAAKSEKTVPRTAKKLQDQSKAFQNTGSTNDFIALRTLQMQNRK